MKKTGIVFRILLTLCMAASFHAKAQVQLTRNDSAQIISGSEEILFRPFQYTLNAISTGQVETDINQAILYSYDSTAGMIQIFKDGDARIEDDLSPLNYRKGPKKNNDKPVSQYLFDYRTWFQGVNKKVSIISGVVCDSLHLVDNVLFATVYFNSSFDVDDNNNWPITKRKAEIVCKKRADNSWDLKIFQIGFNWFDRDSFVVVSSNEIKAKRFSRGLIPDSLPLHYCSYKQKTDLSSQPDSVLEILNHDLIAADQHYFNTAYTQALQKYEKINSVIKGIDYVEKRITNCLALRLNMEKKSEVSIEAQRTIYLNNLHREELIQAKDMLDSIVRMQPNNSSLLNDQKELNTKISIVKEMLNHLKNNETIFKEKIDAKLTSLDTDKEYLYYLRAQYYENRNQHEEALADLNKALDAVPQFINALKLRARVLINLNNSAKALVDLDQLIKEFPKNDTLYGLTGDCYLQDKNFQEATSAYTAALAINSKNPDYYYKRGLSNYQNDKQQNAAFDFRQAIDHGCKEAEAYHKLFRIYFINDKVDSALIYLRTAKSLGLQSGYKKELDSLSIVYFKNGLDQLGLKAFLPAFNAFRISANLNYEKHDAWYNYAKLDVEVYRNYRNAIASMDSALLYNPNNIQYLLLRAQASYLDHQFLKAITDFDLVNKITTATYIEKAQAHEGKADALRGSGNDLVAQDEYNLSLTSRPNNSQVLFKLAKLYEDNKKYLDATKAYTQIIKNSEIDSAYFKRGLSYMEVNDAKSALRDFERALEKNRYYLLANYESGLCNKRNGDLNDAIKNFNEELVLQRNHLPSYVEKADCQYTLKLFKDAFATLHTLLQVDKDFIKKDPLVSQQFAYCCMFENQSMSEAGEYINYGIKFYPNEKYFTFLLAEYSYLNKQLPEAKTNFEECFKAKTVSADQLKKDDIFSKIKKENEDIKKLWKSYYN